MTDKTNGTHKPDIITIIILVIPVGLGLIVILGSMDINGDQVFFKKIPLKTFEELDCNTQLKYLMSTLPPETHKQSYINNCMENSP